MNGSIFSPSYRLPSLLCILRKLESSVLCFLDTALVSIPSGVAFFPSVHWFIICVFWDKWLQKCFLKCILTKSWRKMKGTQGSGKQSNSLERAVLPSAHMSLSENALPAPGFYFIVVLITPTCFPCPWFLVFYISHSQNISSYRPLSGNALRTFGHSSQEARFSESIAAPKDAFQEWGWTTGIISIFYPAVGDTCGIQAWILPVWTRVL